MWVVSQRLQAETTMTATSDTKLQNLSWKVGGMDCASCAATIHGAVERLPGVSDVKLSVMSETLALALDESQTKREAIEKRVAGLGYILTVLVAKATPVPEPAATCGCSHPHKPADATTTAGIQRSPEPLSWKVGGMDCPGCAATIRGALERLPGVSDVKLSVMSETLTLALDETQTKRDAVEKRIRRGCAEDASVEPRSR